MNTHRNTPGGRLTVTASLLAVAALAINTWPAMAVAGGPIDEAAGTIAAAGTATAHVSGTTLYFVGGSAENDVYFDPERHLQDTSGLTAGQGCVQFDPTQVDCSPFNDVVLDLGYGNDTAALGWLFYERVRLTAGNGDDTVYSSGGDDQISGGLGNDYLASGGGRDKVDGQEGDDTLEGGSGDDTVTGGPGRDSVNGDGDSALDDGNDRLYLTDGEKDSAQCGFGADMVEADSIDVVEEFSCENISRTAPPPPVNPTPVNPTPVNPTPVNPTPAPQQQTATVTVPKKIKYDGKTILLTNSVTTNAGQKADAKVSVKPKGKKYSKVKITKKGKVTIKTLGKKKLKVTLKLTAPTTSQYTSYSYTKKWKVKK